MTWHPILAEDEATRARSIAIQIADAVAETPDYTRTGDIMRPLLDAYLARALDSEQHTDRALAALEGLFARARPGLAPGLFGGLAGLGWVATHIGGLLADWLEPQDDKACAEIDRALIRAVQHYREPGEYDLISGLAGIAVYAFERIPRLEPKELLCAIIDRLAATAETAENGTSWHTASQLLPEHQRRTAPDGYYNLGVAHGVPALALVLARAMSAGLRRDIAGSLLHGLVSWIMRQRQSTGAGSRFPAWIAKGGSTAPGSREAWCYGGLGLSVTLLCTAKSTGSAKWEEAARGFARLEAERTIEQSGVSDMCLCHGGAGNGHLYNRLYQATGEDVFLNAALRWLRTALAAHTVSVGAGGFLFLHPKEPGNPLSERVMMPDPSFLSGSTGVGLALLAASSNVEPCWDRLLMADLPPNVAASLS